MSPTEIQDVIKPRAIASVADGIELWWCALDRIADESDLGAWLSSAESARAERFGTEKLRRRWIAGRVSLRFILGAVLGIAPAAVAIRRGVRGRPELIDASIALDFNVSHTDGVAFIGISVGDPRHLRIGVDVERSDRDAGVDRLARKFLTARERAAIAPLSADARRLRFLRYWTCKEAMSKATGDGLIAPFGRLDVELEPHPRLIDGPAPYSPASWELHAAAVPEGFLATVAICHCMP
jgi:4'-phosphopantetheinyl transferase